ncbi:MAG: pseudouridine synthase, partial [Hydrogenovibrio sp.]|nr:pseudouridine synthase [Hydrogenovibrio sp.]
MAKRQWQIVNGIVLLNKPEGITSNDLLQKVRRVYNAKKAGHTGALDPFATGLLPICLGEATKVSGLLLDSDKRYQATLHLGAATDTGDKDGEVIEKA